MGFFLSLVYLVTIFGQVLLVSVAAATLKNITISVPDGSSNHGNPNLLCTPSAWTDIITFYVGNYLAHAVTVISLPGESTISTVKVGLTALLFPTSGLMRGFSTITTFASFAKTDLQKADWSRALCMIVRSQDWKPHAGDVVSDAIFASPLVKPLDRNTTGRDDISTDAASVRVFDSPWSTLKTFTGSTAVVNPNFTIRGSTKLPDGYEFAYVPGDVDFEDDLPPLSPTKISYSYNLVGGLVSLAQAFYALYTIYQTSGDQITRYGYAAFGLTVAPFMTMSIINLGSLFAPNFPALYMVDSSVMAETRKHDGCRVDGVVGKLKEGSAADLATQDDNKFWIQSVSFDRVNNKNQLSMKFQLPSESILNGSSAQERALLIMEEGDGIELPNRAKERVQDTEQEHTRLALRESNQSLASNDGNYPALYIPSCPQVFQSSASTRRKAFAWVLMPILIGLYIWLLIRLIWIMVTISPFDFSWREWKRAFSNIGMEVTGRASDDTPSLVDEEEARSIRNTLMSILKKEYKSIMAQPKQYTIQRDPNSDSRVRISGGKVGIDGEPADSRPGVLTFIFGFF